jgi:hypothetical protein
MPRKKKDDPELTPPKAEKDAPTEMAPEEPTKPEKPLPKKEEPTPEKKPPAVDKPARPSSPAEQAAALAKLDGEELVAERARQKKEHNPKREVPKPDGELKLSARQFVRARKLQWRHAAGFLLTMKRRLGPMARLTVKEWTVHWDEFWTRPVKGPR